MKTVTIALIAFKDAGRFANRLDTVIYPTVKSYLTHNCGPVEVIIVDNSPYGFVDGCVPRSIKELVEVTVIWNCGRNEKYSKSMNCIAKLARYDYLAFLCLNHCRLYDATWLESILLPLEDPKIALSGSLARTDYKYVPELGRGEKFGTHVQGGIFATKTKFLQEHPYDERRFPHKYADIYIAETAISNGFGLAMAPAICSVWQKEIEYPPPSGVKIVHDHARDLFKCY
jgi:hypothetical protein